MNEYDDQDDQDDYSSSNSFRARSNTWPLNRPDFVAPSAGACVDETLPEIELEDDDLFTTNENWPTGLVDQDIMSWDPILNAQNQQQQQQQHQQQPPQPPPPPPPQQQQQQPATIHHHHQPQAQHQTHPVNHHQPPPQSAPLDQGHHRHQSIHITNHQQSQHQQQHQHYEQQAHHRSDLHQANDPFLDVTTNPEGVILAPHMLQYPTQLQQRLSPTQHSTHIQHHTINRVHCLDQDDASEYHIQQMHHLSLDNNPPNHHGNSQQDNYAPTLTSLCSHNTTANLNNDTSYNITSNHHNHHHLQPLSSARYDLDAQGEYEIKTPHDEILGQRVEHHQSHPHHPQMIHNHHHHNQQQTHLQLQNASSSDNHSGGSQLLSSSLGTSGIGLSGDLQDLDYNHPGDPSLMIPNPYDETQQQQQELPKSDVKSIDGDVANEVKQSDPTSTSKTKLNAPRRNAWGNMSYADLISQAINSTGDKRLTLSQIYDWMVQHVPYFKDKGDSNSSAGWKNSVRHNLSLHSRFKRLQNEGTGKSSWWTINPEANIGKCARRRAASMEASKYEKKRGRAKKKAEAIRQGLISYPSVSNSSLNGSATALDQQDSQAQNLNQFNNNLPTSQQSEQSQQQQKPQLQNLDQSGVDQLHHQSSTHPPQLQVQTLDHYVIDQPSQQQQQHLQQLQQSDAQSCDDLTKHVRQDQNLFILSSQSQATQHQEQPRYEENNENNKLQQQQQQQQQQQNQYYYPFELSTAL